MINLFPHTKAPNLSLPDATYTLFVHWRTLFLQFSARQWIFLRIDHAKGSKQELRSWPRPSLNSSISP